MKIKWKTLLICIAIPLLVGGISGLISMNSMQTFAALEKPPLSPPAWLFPVVWTILYILMGIASYLIIASDTTQRETERALSLYALQLFFNFFWSILFFNLGLYWFAFAWLLVLWVLIGLCIIYFSRISNTAALLMVPYFLWVTFAAYLNAGVAYLNA